MFMSLVFSQFPIIYYHAHPNMNFTEEMFSAHMHFLDEEGFTPVKMDVFLDWHQNNAILPLRPIIIGFDDNYIDTYEIAYPILKDLGFVAYNYVITHSVGNVSPTIEYCDWDVLIEMEENGVFFSESHAHTHPHLAELTDLQIEFELNESKTILEQEKEREISHIAYPYGSYDQRVIDMAEQAGYITGKTVIEDFNYRDTPLFELRRLCMDGNFIGQSLEAFRNKLNWSDRQSPPEEKGWIIDSHDTNFSVLDGEWETASEPEAWNGNYFYGSSENGIGEVRWGAYLQVEGDYRLYVWIPKNIDNAGIVEYTIYHQEGSTDITIDQYQPDSDWHELGLFYYDNQTPVDVTLTDNEENTVIADALWIKPSEVTAVSDWQLYSFEVPNF